MAPDTRRSVRLLAASVAVSWAGVLISGALGSVVVLHLTNDLRLTGLPFIIVAVGSGLAAIPSGRLMDRFGRVPVLAGGHGLGALGFAIGAAAIRYEIFPLFLAGLAVSSLGAGATYLTRLAAADLFPAARRARGLSLAVFMATVGAVLGTPLVWLAQRLAPVLDLSYLVVAWGFGPVLGAISALLVLQIRPDPSVVAREIQAAEPDAAPSPHGPTHTQGGAVIPAAAVLMLAQGAMVTVMSVAGASLDHAGHSAGFISLTMTAHIFGMFFFSPWVGRLADTWGRKPLLVTSAVLLVGSTVAVALVPVGPVLSLALFVVGVGWSCAFVSASAVVADATAIARRGRVTGLMDFGAAAMGALGALAAGWALDAGGLSWVGRIGAALALAVLLAALLVPAAHTRPPGISVAEPLPSTDKPE